MEVRLKNHHCPKSVSYPTLADTVDHKVTLIHVVKEFSKGPPNVHDFKIHSAMERITKGSRRIRTWRHGERNILPETPMSAP